MITARETTIGSEYRDKPAAKSQRDHALVLKEDRFSIPSFCTCCGPHRPLMILMSPPPSLLSAISAWRPFCTFCPLSIRPFCSFAPSRPFCLRFSFSCDSRPSPHMSQEALNIALLNIRNTSILVTGINFERSVFTGGVGWGAIFIRPKDRTSPFAATTPA